jgi:hypothetical protein
MRGTSSSRCRTARGTWKNVGDLLGTDYVIGGGTNEDMDTPVGTASFRIRRRNGSISLSPLVVGSILNVDDGGLYAPLLEKGRAFRVWSATIPNGTVPVAGDWREGMQGRIDAVAWESDPIVIDCSDLGVWLADTQIKVDGVQYGTTPVGTPLADVLQAIVDDTPSRILTPAQETVYVNTTNDFAVTAWAQGEAKVLDGTRNLVQQTTGDDFRFRYDAAHQFRLTLFDPQRDRTSVDWTLGPEDYYPIRRLSSAIVDIRNSGELTYAGGAVPVTSPADILSDPSVLAYGERFFRLPQNDAITTELQAQTLLDIVVADLNDGPLDLEVAMPMFWPVQLYDRITFSATADHFDEAQTLMVAGIRHEFDGLGQATTTLRLGGKVVGAYADWLRRLVPTRADADRASLTDVQWTFTDTSAVITFVYGPEVAEVWGGYTVVPSPGSDADFDLAVAALDRLAAGATSFTVPRPVDGQATLVHLQPYRADGTAGNYRRLAITASAQPPTREYDDSETATLGTQWIRLSERGIAVTYVRAQIQIETSAFTAMSVPTRGPGDVSVVRGGTLGDNEYEQDVPLSATKGRQTFVRFEWLLENGRTITSPDFGFDAGRAPNILKLSSTIAVVDGAGDSDVQSWKITDGSTWTRTVDSQFLNVDVSLADDDGTAGLAANASATYTVTAYNVPVSEQATASSDAKVTQTLVVYNGTGSGGSGGSSAATWLSVQAVAPSVGLDEMTIKLQASAAPVGWVVKVFVAEPSSGTPIDRTALLFPVPSAPPTTLTSYAYDSAYDRTASGAHSQLIAVLVRAELRDAGAVVKDTRTVTVSWYTPSFL